MWKPEDIAAMDDDEIINNIAMGEKIAHLIEPERFSSKDIVKAVFRDNPRNLSYIPHEFWDYNLKFKVLDVESLNHYIHDEMFTPGFVAKYVNHDIYRIKKIPHHHQTISVAIRAVKRDLKLLLYINPKYYSTIIELAVESETENGGFRDIKRAFDIELGSALFIYNEVLLENLTSPNSKALSKIYHYRLAKLEPQELNKLAKEFKAFDAYRALTSTAEALDLMSDLGRKRQWMEDDLSL